jgi:hypothetical protein
MADSFLFHGVYLQTFLSTINIFTIHAFWGLKAASSNAAPMAHWLEFALAKRGAIF